MKALGKHTKCTNLRAGDQDVMFDLLGVRKGAVSLFSIVNDKDKKVKLIVDKRLLNNFEYVGFHPMINSATTAVTKADI